MSRSIFLFSEPVGFGAGLLEIRTYEGTAHQRNVNDVTNARGG